MSVTTGRREVRWASTALDLQPKRPLYRLFASLSGFLVEATVFADGAKAYACAITIDGVHEPGSPRGGFATVQAAVSVAKEVFAGWTEEILQRL